MDHIAVRKNCPSSSKFRGVRRFISADAGGAVTNLFVMEAAGFHLPGGNRSKIGGGGRKPEESNGLSCLAGKGDVESGGVGVLREAEESHGPIFEA
jgi:hypothetical protein